MKRTVILMLTVLFFVMNASSAFAAPAKKAPEAKPIALTVNYERVTMTKGPIVQKNVLFIPSGLLPRLGATAQLSKDKKTITIKKSGYVLIITQGSTTAKLDGASIKLKQKAALINGTFYIPAEVLSTYLNVIVKWDSKKNSLLLIDGLTG